MELVYFLVCGEALNYKVSNSVTLFLVKPFPQVLWFSVIRRNRVSTERAKICNTGFYARTCLVVVVSKCLFPRRIGYFRQFRAEVELVLKSA